MKEEEQISEEEYNIPSLIDVFKKSTFGEVIRLVSEILIAVSLLIYFIASLVLKKPYEGSAVVVLSLIGGMISLQDLILQMIISRRMIFQEYKRQYIVAENLTDEALRKLEKEYGDEAKARTDKIISALEEIKNSDKRVLSKDELVRIFKEHKFTKVDFEILKELLHPELDDLIESDEERQQIHDLIENKDEHYEKLDVGYRKFYVISILASVIVVIVLYILGVNASGKEWTTAADIATVIGFVTMLLTKAVTDVVERYLEILTDNFDDTLNEGQIES